MTAVTSILITVGIIGSMCSVAALNTIARFKLDVPYAEKAALAVLALSMLLLTTALATIIKF